MLLDRAWIAARIPHQGAMCLLEGVEYWDAQHVVCRAVGHRFPDNPLRSEGRLASACGIEYAAQAMAVHGALLANDNALPRSGFLASVRSTSLHVARLDDIDVDLIVQTDRFSGDGNSVLYDFSVRAGNILLLEGRAAVILNAG